MKALLPNRRWARNAWVQAVLLVICVCLAGISNGRAETSSDPSVAGRKLYQNRCAKCHRMYDPAKYSDAQWQAWMVKMGKKAKLRPEEKQAVLKYVDEALRAPAKESGTK